MSGKAECSHSRIRLWTLGNYLFFARCENCGMASESYDTQEEAVSAPLVRARNPGL